MEINKPLVTTALGYLGESFTVGELVDAVLEAVERAKRKIFYHPKIMLSDSIMRLSIVDVTDSLIITYDDHINAIENNIRRMVGEMIWVENEDGENEIDEGELECLNDYIDNYLHENVAYYDGDEKEQAVQAIINNDMFTSLRIQLRQSWEETTLSQISQFYRGFTFKQRNKDALDLALETYNEMSILGYIENLSGILGLDDDDN